MDIAGLQITLQRIQRMNDVAVAFVTDRDGALVSWTGQSEAFSPNGRFVKPTDSNQPNLYLAAFGEYYVGVLFDPHTTMEHIRALVEQEGNDIEEALGTRGVRAKP